MALTSRYSTEELVPWPRSTIRTQPVERLRVGGYHPSDIGESGALGRRVKHENFVASTPLAAHCDHHLDGFGHCCCGRYGGRCGHTSDHGFHSSAARDTQ